MKTVFDFEDYKNYLAQSLDTKGASRGKRSRLAKVLGCQTAFVSQIINGNSHFSLEHAIRINDFLGHNEEESQFFMLLVHHGRAGSRGLKDYYFKQMSQVLKKREIIRERIQVGNNLTEDAQVRYYSCWYYVAVHILLSIPKYQTKAAIAEFLKLSLSAVSDCLGFLVASGLATVTSDRYRIGTTRIHLGQDSLLVNKHHTNWRMRAIHSLDVPSKGDLHYSSVISLSESDGAKVRAILLDAIERTEPILKESKEEAAFCMALDFFKL
jgi:uncharacterized protein (TIGR02147 family)